MNPTLAAGNFFGDTLRHFQAGEFRLSETSYRPGLRLPRHSHASHYFGFILKGRYREDYGQKVRSCEPSMLICHPAGELHAQHFDRSTVRLFRIEMNQARLEHLHSDLRLKGCDFRAGLPVTLAGKLYRELREPDAISPLAIEGLGLELIATIARHKPRGQVSGRPPRWLSHAHDLIKTRFREELTLGEIARTVGVHPVTLAREFRRHYDCTIGTLVRQERISFACRQLLKTEPSISNVAIAAGFYDQSHFTKTFKRLMGVTPARYRESLGGHES